MFVLIGIVVGISSISSYAKSSKIDDFVYIKEKSDSLVGSIKVVFIDEWGNELFPSVIAEGPVGDYYSSYPITPPELSGYEWNLANDVAFFDPENDGDAPEPVRYVYMLSTSETSTNHSDKKGNRKLPQTCEKYSYLIIGVGIIILLSATCYFIFIKGSVAKF